MLITRLPIVYLCLVAISAFQVASFNKQVLEDGIDEEDSPSSLLSDNDLDSTLSSTETSDFAGPSHRREHPRTQASKFTSCGMPKIKPFADSDRIVGGRRAKAYSWPWQVLVLSDVGDGRMSQCGGSIIDNQWIVTAAHCIKEGPTTVYAGIVNSRNLKEGVSVTVAKKIPHQRYSKFTKKNDIALLKLSRPLTFNDKIRAVCLADSGTNDPKVGTLVTVTGWGRLGTTKLTSGPLMEVTFPLRQLSYCKFTRSLDDSQMCAGDYNPNEAKSRDSCMGDSGGPLVVKNGAYYLTGIVSFGPSQCNGQGVYTKVDNYIDWIKSTIQRESKHH